MYHFRNSHASRNPFSGWLYFLLQFLGDDTMKKIGAIYIRVSTDKQEELSPDAQLRLLKEYADRNDILIPNEFVFQDNGISGRKADKRPAFQQMIAIAKSKEHPIDCIIVWKFSRFARNQEESILYKSLLKKNDVEVISISENTTGEFGSLIERIIEWMDEYYSIRLSGEVIRGMTENAMRGNYQAAPPIGYKHIGNGQPPVIDPETVIIPLTIKNRFMSGQNTFQIARYCNEQGWRTKRGNQYETRLIEYILQNPFYAGKIRWNYTERGRKLKPSEEVILSDGKHEALWSYEEYLEILNIFQLRKSKNRKQRSVSSCKHWLSGILICSNCGHTLSYSISNNGFQCWAYGKGTCKVSHHISEKKITTYVIDGLKQLLQSDALYYEIVQTQSDDSREKIRSLQKELARIEQREKRAKAAYLDGIDTKEEYKANRIQFDNDRKLLESRLQELEIIEDTHSKEEMDAKMIQNIQDVLTILDNPEADYEAKGNAIRSIVDNIVFDRTNTALDFTLKLQI